MSTSAKITALYITPAKSQPMLDVPQVEAVALGMPQAIADLTLGDFTLQTWFKTTDASRAILMGSYVGGVDAMNFELHTSNRLRIGLRLVPQP